MSKTTKPRREKLPKALSLDKAHEGLFLSAIYTRTKPSRAKLDAVQRLMEMSEQEMALAIAKQILAYPPSAEITKEKRASLVAIGAEGLRALGLIDRAAKGRKS